MCMCVRACVRVCVCVCVCVYACVYVCMSVEIGVPENGYVELSQNRAEWRRQCQTVCENACQPCTCLWRSGLS